MERTTPAPSPQGIVWMTLSFEGGLLLLAVVAGWLLDHPPTRLLDFNARSWVVGIAATLPVLGLMVWSAKTRLRPVAKLLRLVQERIVPLFAACSTLDLALISLAAGLGEEALFRGVLQPWLIELTNPWIGLVAVSVLFGLAHPVSVTYAVAAAGIGLYLGGLLLLTGSLLPPILVHALYDFAALLYLLRLARSPRSDSGNGV